VIRPERPAGLKAAARGGDHHVWRSFHLRTGAPGACPRSSAPRS